MRVDRQLRSPIGLWLSACVLLLAMSSCAVYTVNKTELESQLRAKHAHQLDIKKIYRKAFKNHIDSLACHGQNGLLLQKKISVDSKIAIVTKNRGTIKYYAKTLYIYNNEFLIGERTAPKLYGPNYYPIRLSEIERIELIGSAF